MAADKIKAARDALAQATSEPCEWHNKIDGVCRLSSSASPEDEGRACWCWERAKLAVEAMEDSPAPHLPSGSDPELMPSVRRIDGCLYVTIHGTEHGLTDQQAEWLFLSLHRLSGLLAMQDRSARR